MSFVLGLDLGQTQDYSALAALERTAPIDGKASYAVVGLHRFQLGTAYTSKNPLSPGVGEQLLAMFTASPLAGSMIAVDQTGVGRAVVDTLRTLNLPATLVPVTITSGRTLTQAENGDWHCPKVDLVAVLQVLFQSGRLQIRPELKLAKTLITELDSFRVKVTAAANETFNAREGEHDDLVLGVALAAWLAERCPDFTAASIGMGQRGPVASPPRGVSMGGDFRNWPRGV